MFEFVLKTRWLLGKTETLVWIWVANLVYLWFCYQVVVEISNCTVVPKIFVNTHMDVTPIHYVG